jgi:hypothetical protein
MPFLLQATVDDHVLTATFDTAKEVFAKAVEWHVVGRFTNINIDDGTESYSIDEFSSMMALGEIANTVEPDMAERLKKERRLD